MELPLSARETGVFLKQFFRKYAGIIDSNDSFYEDMLIAGRRTNKPELVRAMIDAGRQQFEWTVAGGVRPTAVGVNSGLRIPRAHKFNPVEVISHLRQCAKKLGVKNSNSSSR